MQMREIEVSKRELGRYASKKKKNGRAPANVGDLAALQLCIVSFHRNVTRLDPPPPKCNFDVIFYKNNLDTPPYNMTLG